MVLQLLHMVLQLLHKNKVGIHENMAMCTSVCYGTNEVPADMFVHVWCYLCL